MKAPLLTLLTLVALNGSSFGEDDRFFRDRVAPILETRCVRCHNDATAKGKLSLSTPRAARAGGTTGPLMVAGQPDESLLLEKVVGDKPEMPKGSPPLSAEQVATLRTWVAQGAHWPDGLTLKDRAADGTWWSLQPLSRPPIPLLKTTGWGRTPIDAFVLDKLQKAGLSPSPEADRRTLIRRLSFDLTGLPPTPEEVAAFLADPSPDAYETLVDRLLASPRYGERWGRHWLDVAHYGDTHGYDKDKRRDNAWRYRDYVIKALNDDIPYARLIREQVAGDVLWPGEPRGVIATGFLAAGPWDFVGHVELREGTVDKEKTRLLDRDDMLASTLSTFVSLTVHCARCHDHKFDPIPQKDYYALQAVFAGVDRGDRSLPDPATTGPRLALEHRKAEAEARWKELDRKMSGLVSPELVRLDATLEALRGQLAALPRPTPSPPSPTNGYHSSIHPSPEARAWVQVDLGASMPIDEIRVIPARPTDFRDTPGFGLPAEFRVEVSDDPSFQKSSTLDFGKSPDGEPVVIRPGAVPARYVRVSTDRLWKRINDYIFALAELEVISGDRNVARDASVTALDSIEAGRWGRKALVDGFDSRARRPDVDDPAARRHHDLLVQLQRYGRDRQVLADTLIPPSLRAEREAAAGEVAAIVRKIRSLPVAPMVYAVNPHTPRPIRLLRRGDVEQPAEEIAPGALSCVPGLKAAFDLSNPADEGARRVALADWIADRNNVLTWRSIANRVWHYHFGRGLVDTPNDFGRNGSLPTHPELLDWLAVEFRDGGGSLKALHRLIVRSAVYRQASSENPKADAIDADNRLLWRMNRRRLEAEAVRDSVLANAGVLDLTMGGPAFALFRFKDDHSPIYDHTDLAMVDSPAGRRRAIYRFIVRSVPNPFLECLDGADPNINTPVRTSTITALQALALLNDPFMIKQSERFARRLERESPDPSRRIDRAYTLAFGRPPSAEERFALSAYATKHGLANACRLLWNANEFLFVD